MSKPVEFEIVTELQNHTKPVHIRVRIAPNDPCTRCDITSQTEPIYPDYWNLESVGMGVRKHGDRYDRETGCRMALASALRHSPMNGDLSKVVRKMIWAKYLELFPVEKRTAAAKAHIWTFTWFDGHGHFDRLMGLIGAAFSTPCPNEIMEIPADRLTSVTIGKEPAHD